MAKRRQAARREAGAGRIRRWLSLAGRTVAAAALLVGAGWGVERLLDPATLPVKSVHIRGAFERVGRNELTRAIEPFTTAGFLRLDVDAIRTSVERIAWVHTASVRRTWPAGLAVTLQEQQAVARWGDGGLLNSDGVRFVPNNDAAPAGLPLLAGPAGSEADLMVRYREMQGMLAPLELNVARLEMDARRAIRLQLANGLELNFGRRNVNRRLLRFVRTYAGVIEPRLDAVDAVDLRYTNGFAVRWKPGAVAAAA